jgi:hypothetical protein
LTGAYQKQNHWALKADQPNVPRIAIQRDKDLMALVILVVSSAQAEPIRFEAVHNGGNCAGCGNIQATGEITPDTENVADRRS